MLLEARREILSKCKTITSPVWICTLEFMILQSVSDLAWGLIPALASEAVVTPFPPS